ncbi:MAG: hypothetical protein DMF84_29325 [Acidobacteria bacterium]|nr:MAG: hypothetical protein DMF84_29325 [Acidobacteriota bacterium]
MARWAEAPRSCALGQTTARCSEGFSRTHTIAIVLAWVLKLTWMIWLVVVAWHAGFGARVAWP